ncbi:hypothetical protein TSUD_64910 [Trifolium subterraneum]|uniref:TF-B3 domain-containing protein n=1 Tax=Trifolium subterraneum TaxID=3900 RepID=A0A2Z6NQ21_TRISU|nr:hypothetical protein TSUD_64910 [Trifolium subterraneum]
MMLHEEDYNNSSDSPVTYFNTPTIFFHALEKKLTSKDTKSGVLKLSWHGFCEQALPRQGSGITLVGWLGYTWECYFDFGDPDKKTCQITGQWLDICKKHRLVEGITVKFGVTHASDNRVIYLKIAPFIGIRTTLIGSQMAAGYKAFYQTENYFLL